MSRPLLSSFFSPGTSSSQSSSPPPSHSRFSQSFKSNSHASAGKTNNQPPAQSSSNTPGPLSLIVVADDRKNPFLSTDVLKTPSSYKIFYVELDDTRDLTDGELFKKIRKAYEREAGFLRWKNLFNMHTVSGISYVKVSLFVLQFFNLPQVFACINIIIASILSTI